MNNNIYAKIYGWMFIGLIISFLTGYMLSYNPKIVYNIMLTGWFYLVLILELGIVIFFSARINKMSTITATICYILYSILTGLTFSVIFLAYEMTSILTIFGITSALFGIFAVYGYITKKDLTKLGTFLLMGLLGIILASVINIFLKSTQMNFIVSIIGIIVFILFIAYDVNKIKNMIYNIGDDKGAIYCAFQLYLDFINIFLRLINLVGKRND